MKFKSDSTLEKKLREGRFVVTAELGPPKSADGDVIRQKARILNGYCDGINITDNQTAVVRMSSLSASLIVKEEGLEPIMQMTTRDRNVLALQSDILGASALGINNILCLTGDPITLGNHKESRAVFEIDGLGLTSLIKTMRDEKKFFNGEEMKLPPRIFIGSAENPFVETVEIRAGRFEQKVQAGADFFQTQYVFDLERFRQWLEKVGEKGLLGDHHYLIAGVGPLKSAAMAERINNPKYGITIPEKIMDRLRSSKDQAREGFEICLEIIAELRTLKGVSGIHIMAPEGEQTVARIVEESGLAAKKA